MNSSPSGTTSSGPTKVTTRRFLRIPPMPSASIGWVPPRMSVSLFSPRLIAAPAKRGTRSTTATCWTLPALSNPSLPRLRMMSGPSSITCRVASWWKPTTKRRTAGWPSLTPRRANGSPLLLRSRSPSNLLPPPVANYSPATLRTLPPMSMCTPSMASWRMRSPCREPARPGALGACMMTSLSFTPSLH